MPIKPRFHRAAASERRFVDREQVMQAFAEELNRVGAGPRVLNVYGVGGIGKSRLIRELRNGAITSEGPRTALLDLQVPAMRQHEDALAVLRMEFGQQKVRFDRFDIAYAVLWQRLHPNLKINARDLPFVQESEVLQGILDMTGVPVFGTAVALARLAERTTSRVRLRRKTKADEVLQVLDDLDNTEVLDAVTYLFAEDLRAASDDRPYVLFVDAYEALMPPTARGSVADAWLRDLIAQLDRGLVVVASREPLGWQTYDSDWAQLIRPCPVRGLPTDARMELLVDAGVANVAEQRALARASEGLPFYLHLAIDTRIHAGNTETAVVSSEEILQRFLHHVAPNEIRSLELLSVARIFDYEIFKELAAAFELPRDRMTWESLTSYSFVHPAGAGNLRLHQLMAVALCKRLSPHVLREAHLRMRELWERRAATGNADEEVLALREAIYHGVHASAISPDEILAHADRAVRRGGRKAIDAIVTDLREFLADTSDDDLAMTARCLEAESAIIMGDATRAGLAAATGPRSELATAAGARLAVANAHSLRIAGDTNEAATIYDAVWRHHQGGARYVAALWIADIHMWQGRFGTAFTLCQEALDSPGLDDPVLRGDIVRLMQLGHRFHLNLEESATTLDTANAWYAQAKAIVGSANILTNRAELLAWTDPAAAVPAAMTALEAQHGLGALHELGKTHTALAIALIRLDRLQEAADSFEAACDYLERARYRSGRARAEFFRGFLHARRGDLAAASASLTWSVQEFVEAAVYPTMIIAAARTLDRLDSPDQLVTEAAERARTEIEPLDSITALEERIDKLIDAILGETS